MRDKAQSSGEEAVGGTEVGEATEGRGDSPNIEQLVDHRHQTVRMGSRCKRLALRPALTPPTESQLCWSQSQICRLGLVGSFELTSSQMVVACWLAGPLDSHTPGDSPLAAGASVQMESLGGFWENSPYLLSRELGWER